MDDQWFDNFISTITNPVSVNSSTVVQVEQSLISYLSDNRYLIVKIGQFRFKEFLDLAFNNKNFEALLKVYENVSNADLIAKYEGNAEKLAEIANSLEIERQFWMGLLQQVGGKLVSLALSTLL